jgi:hypothetical protein
LQLTRHLLSTAFSLSSVKARLIGVVNIAILFTVEYGCAALKRRDMWSCRWYAGTLMVFGRKLEVEQFLSAQALIFATGRTVRLWEEAQRSLSEEAQIIMLRTTWRILPHT